MKMMTIVTTMLIDSDRESDSDSDSESESDSDRESYSVNDNENESESDSQSNNDSDSHSYSHSESENRSESESERSVRGWFEIRYEMAHKNTFKYMYLLIQLHDSLLKMQKPLIYACIQTLYYETDILYLYIFALKK